MTITSKPQPAAIVVHRWTKRRAEEHGRAEYRRGFADGRESSSPLVAVAVVSMVSAAFAFAVGAVLF